MKIADLFLTKKAQKNLSFKGWIINNRGNNQVRFLTINDGTSYEHLQVVIKNELKEVENYRIGSAIEVSGELVLTPNSKQPFELLAQKTVLLKQNDIDYPLQKKGISKEVLREIPHLRHRTNLFRAIMRIRSTLVYEIHHFFYEHNFLNVAAPILTGNDGEGAGETFIVDSEEGNFFGKKATLGVTGQLHAEAYANGFGNVYTFAPTFRAEKSHTKKHIAEFWMIEPEMAFTNKNQGIKLAEKLLKTVIKKTIVKHKEEFVFLETYVRKDVLTRLEQFLKKDLKQITYQEAIEILQKHKQKFEEQNIVFGLDLKTEHEKYLAEHIFKGPIVIIDYPKEIKAFYMKQNQDQKTVAAFDILVPGIGELVGGSERETNYQKILKRTQELKIDQEDLQWYLDLRRFGQAKSTGFGLGFERLVMYVTGIENIRDTIPFPRSPKQMKM